MFLLADQTAGPNGLIFLLTLLGRLGVFKVKNNFFIFYFFKFFSHGQRRALQLVTYKPLKRIASILIADCKTRKNHENVLSLLQKGVEFYSNS